jgi:outer membrane protein
MRELTHLRCVPSRVAMLAALFWVGAPTIPQVASPSAPTIPADRPLTVEAAVEVALANHPSLAASQHQLEAARAVTIETKSQLGPSAALRVDYSGSTSGGGTGDQGVQTAATGGGFSSQYAASLSVDQLLFDFGRTRDELRKSRLDEQAAALRRAQTEADVVHNVRQAFLAVITNQELLEVARHRVRLQEDTLAMVQAQFDEGTVPGADVAKASAALAAAHFDVRAAENAVAVAAVALNEAMGINVRTEYSVLAPALPEVPELALDQLLNTASQSRPELLAARTDVAAAEAQLSAARKSRKPTVSASAGYGARQDSFPPTEDYLSVGMTLSMSLFDSGLTRGRAQQARAQRDAAEANEHDTAQRIAQETAQALLDLQTAREQITSAEASVVSATEDLDLATGRYRANFGILLEVLDAQANLTAAQADLAYARFDFLAAHYSLERAVGAPPTDLTPAADEAPGNQP